MTSPGRQRHGCMPTNQEFCCPADEGPIEEPTPELDSSIVFGARTTSLTADQAVQFRQGACAQYTAAVMASLWQLAGVAPMSQPYCVVLDNEEKDEEEGSGAVVEVRAVVPLSLEDQDRLAQEVRACFDGMCSILLK